ncbi:MAG: glutaredoxin family protein [Patescibacteria group bacterium]
MITIYGTSFCGDCMRSKRYLESKNIEFKYINIEDNEELISLVQKLNNGMQSVPTIVFPDGSVLTEPSNSELAKKLESIN